MVAKNNLAALRIQLIRPMVIGGLIALGVASFFVFSAGNPNPEWGRYWMVRPLVIIPLAGASAGTFYGLMDIMRRQGELHPALAILLGVIVYIIALWLGIVMGLEGTLWD